MATKHGLPLPRYEFDGVYLNLTIYRNAEAAIQSLEPAIVKKLSGSERKGWAWLTSKGAVKSSEYALATDNDERTARRHLNYFLELKLVKKIGSGPSTQYQIRR